MSKCKVSRKAKSQITVLDKIFKNSFATDIITKQNNGNSLDLNPDGSQSEQYNKLIAEGYSKTDALLLRSSMFSSRFVKEHGRWFDDFQAEPVLEIGDTYNHNIPAVLHENKLVHNMPADAISMGRVNTVSRKNAGNSPFTTYGTFDSAVDLLGTTILKYTNSIMKAREALAKAEGRVLTETEFRAARLSMDIRDIKSSIQRELLSLSEVYNNANRKEGAFIAKVYKDMKTNMTDANIWNQTVNRLKTNIVGETESAKDAYINDGAEGQFMKRLYDKHDHSKSNKEDISNTVKNILLTIEDKIYDKQGNVVTTYDENTGLPKPANYDALLNYIRDNTSNIELLDSEGKPDYSSVAKMTSTDDMMIIFSQMGAIHPSVQDVYDILKDNNENSDGQTVNAFYYNLNNMQRQGINTYISSNNMQTLIADIKLINVRNVFSKSDVLAERLRSQISNKNITSKDMEVINELLKTPTNDYVKNTENLIKAAQMLRIPLTDVILEQSKKIGISKVADIRSIIVGIANDATELVNMVETNPLGLKLDILDTSTTDGTYKKRMLGRLNYISRVLVKFEMNTFEGSFLNNNREREYNLNDSNDIVDTLSWLKNTNLSKQIKNKNSNSYSYEIADVHKQFINNLIDTPGFEHSVWFPSLGQLRKKGINNLKDEDYYNALLDFRSISFEDYAGSNNKALGIRDKFSGLSENEWLKSIAVNYVQNVKQLSEGTNIVRTPALIFADSSTYGEFKHNRLDTSVPTEFMTGLRKSMFAQELSRMISARDILFTHTNKGYGIKEKYREGGEAQLYENYHYTNNEILYSKSNKEKGQVKGQVTGNVFKFKNLPGLNNTLKDYFDDKGLPTKNLENLLPYLDMYDSNFYNNPKLENELKDIMRIVDAAITQSLVSEKQRMSDKFLPIKLQLVDMITRKANDRNTREGVLKNDQKIIDAVYDNFIRDFSINTMVSNNEQMLMFHGVTAAHKSTIEVNKRAKKGISPGRTGGLVGLDPTIKIAIIDDIELTSTYVERMSNVLSKSELTDIEAGYVNMEVADGQGYITPDGYAKQLIARGEFIGDVRNMFEFVETDVDTGAKNVWRIKDDVSERDLTTLLKPIKPYYSTNHYDSQFKIYTPLQIKDSLTVLIPQFVKGTKLNDIYVAMSQQKIEHLVLKSAIKNGIHNVNKLTNKNDDTLNPQVLNNLNVIELDRGKFRNQVDTANHHEDTKIKAGIQIFKLIVANIGDNMRFDYKGYDTGRAIKDRYYELIGNVLEANSKHVISRMSTVYNTDGSVNYENYRKLLIELAGDRITDADLQLLELKPDKSGFIIGLDFIAKSKFESLLNSLFTKNITDIKVPGVHNVYMSNAYMTPSAISDKGLSDKYKMSKDKMPPVDKNGEPIPGAAPTRELQYYKDKNGNWVFEAMMPAWSKDFYDINGNVKDIDSLSPEVREMLGYRIPTSARHSAFTIKVVGFMPKNMGSVVVLPHDVVGRTGADFDIDTFYINRHTHEYDAKSDKYISVKYNKLTKRELPYSLLSLPQEHKNQSYKYGILNKYLQSNGYYDYTTKVYDEYKNSMYKLYNTGKVANARKVIKDNIAILKNNKNLDSATLDKVELDVIELKNKIRNLENLTEDEMTNVLADKVYYSEILETEPNNEEAIEKLSLANTAYNLIVDELSELRNNREALKPLSDNLKNALASTKRVTSIIYDNKKIELAKQQSQAKRLMTLANQK